MEEQLLFNALPAKQDQEIMVIAESEEYFTESGQTLSNQIKTEIRDESTAYLHKSDKTMDKKLDEGEDIEFDMKISKKLSLEPCLL